VLGDGSTVEFNLPPFTDVVGALRFGKCGAHAAKEA